jgi:prolipoprotein diacylglyceryltransferase
MLPYLEIGPFRVETYSAVYALAVVAAGGVFLYRLLRRRFQAGPSARGLLWVVLGGVVGANLGGGVALAYELLAGRALPVAVKSNSFLGALAGGLLAAVLVCRHYRVSFWRACDRGIPALPLGQAIGRLGCLARGCCYGLATLSPLGLYLPDNQGHWTSRYPTQLLDGAASLLVMAALLLVERALSRRPSVDGETRGEGFVTLLYAGLYLLQRFGIEFLRGDALPAWLGPLNSTQLTCLAGLLVVAVLAAWRRRRRSRALTGQVSA